MTVLKVQSRTSDRGPSEEGTASVKDPLTQYQMSDYSTALNLEPNYLKALLRRANACEALEKYEEALEGEAFNFVKMFINKSNFCYRLQESA